MNGLNKFFFWFFVIVLAFMPYGIIMSFALLLLHYGVPYIKSEIKEVFDDCSSSFEKETVEEYDFTINLESKTETLNEYSDDTLEEMK